MVCPDIRFGRSLGWGRQAYKTILRSRIRRQFPTITVEQVFTGGQIQSSTTYELHRWDPKDKREAINRSGRQLFPTLYKPIIDESIIIDNLLLNGGMEDWTSGVPDSWTEVNSPTTTPGDQQGISPIQFCQTNSPFRLRRSTDPGGFRQHG